jgi:hypothetical protein
VPSRSRTSRIALSSPVPWMEKKIGTAGRSSSIAVMTPSVITSVRANAPQKFTTRLRTRGLSSTSRSAGVALV